MRLRDFGGHLSLWQPYHRVENDGDVESGEQNLAVPSTARPWQQRIPQGKHPKTRTNLEPANNKACVISFRLWFPDRDNTPNSDHSVRQAGLLDGYSFQVESIPSGWCGGCLRSREWRLRRKRRQQKRVRPVVARTLRSWKSGTTRLLTPLCDYAKFSPSFCRQRTMTLRMKSKEKVLRDSGKRTMAAQRADCVRRISSFVDEASRTG